jgi:hypothetical protein
VRGQHDLVEFEQFGRRLRLAPVGILGIASISAAVQLRLGGIHGFCHSISKNQGALR